MQKFLFSKRRWLRWVILSIGAVVLAIALSHALNRSPSLSYSPLSPSNPASERSITSAPTPNTVSDAVQVESKYDRSLIHYATVSRSDGTFRQMFVDSDSIAAIQPGEALPEGTLIVMETWHSPDSLGTVFVKQKRNGEWQYGSFSPDRPNYRLGFSGSCHSCHLPFREADFTPTKLLLEAALQTRQVQSAFCDRPGRTPCAPQVYVPDAVRQEEG